jgi:hypothetical protein
MKPEHLEYDENGKLIHRILFYSNGNKVNEEYYNVGKYHNIYNPSRIGYSHSGKIQGKRYSINDSYLGNDKLGWQNNIKHII